MKKEEEKENYEAEIEDMKAQIKELETERDEIGAELDEGIRAADSACDTLSRLIRRFR